MVSIDDTLEQLELLYQAIGGYHNYEIWDETAMHGKSLEEVLRSFEDEHGRKSINRQIIVDYWSDLENIGLLDENWRPTEFGEAWAQRTESAVQSLYMTDAGIGENRRELGNIFYTLGTRNTLPTLHLLYNEEDISDHMQSFEILEPLENMHRHGFIEDESYSNGNWRSESDILTDKARTVYEEVVDPDYEWMSAQEF